MIGSLAVRAYRFVLGVLSSKRGVFAVLALAMMVMAARALLRLPLMSWQNDLLIDSSYPEATCATHTVCSSDSLSLSL
jgi:hypothetical protein